jgi:hypothetical protein
VLAFITYAGTLGFQFVYDDLQQIVGNPHVQSWSYVPRYFTSHIWSHVSPEWGGAHYRPLFLLWLLINHTIFGLNPLGWHLMTILAYLFAISMMYLVIEKVTQTSATAAVAALIFGLHPLHIEAVAWVSGVAESLLAALLLCSFLFHLKKREQTATASRIRLQSFSLSLFAVALLTKETAIVFPAIIFAYEWVFGERDFESNRLGRLRASLSIIVPYLVVVAIYIPIRLSALKGFGATITPLSPATVLLTLPSLLWFYVKLLIWPFGLSAFYDTPYTTSVTFSTFILPAIAVALLGFAIWFGSRKSRVVAFACAWLVLPIIPVLNLPSLLRDEIAHDRYLFLPSIGFSILIALAITRIKVGRSAILGLPACQVAAIVILCGVLGCAAAWQHSSWANEFLLFEQGVKSAPNNRIALNNLGSIMLENGMYAEAVNLFKKAVDCSPDFRTANLNLGISYCQVGQYEEACQDINRAIELDPKGVEPYLYLAISEIERGRFPEGRNALAVAEKIRKDTPGIHFWRGMAYKKEKALAEAVNEFRAELEINPADRAALQQVSEIESQRAMK